MTVVFFLATPAALPKFDSVVEVLLTFMSKNRVQWRRSQDEVGANYVNLPLHLGRAAAVVQLAQVNHEPPALVKGRRKKPG